MTGWLEVLVRGHSKWKIHEKFIRLQVKVLSHKTLTHWSTMLRTFPLSFHLVMFVPSLVSHSDSQVAGRCLC